MAPPEQFGYAVNTKQDKSRKPINREYEIHLDQEKNSFQTWGQMDPPALSPKELLEDCACKTI